MAGSLTIFGWLISLGPGLAFALAFEGFTMATLVIGLGLTTIALGTILPIVRDAGLVKSPFGARVLAIGPPLVPRAARVASHARIAAPRVACTRQNYCRRRRRHVTA